jgi:hypothetical protein
MRWSLEDLSALTGIGVTTLARFEGEVHTPRRVYLQLIRDKMEAAGLRFTSNGGVVPPR